MRVEVNFRIRFGGLEGLNKRPYLVSSLALITTAKARSLYMSGICNVLAAFCSLTKEIKQITDDKK